MFVASVTGVDWVILCHPLLRPHILVSNLVVLVSLFCSCPGKERGKETAAKWKEDEWDENDARDDLSLQLKKEFENSSKKDGATS